MRKNKGTIVTCVCAVIILVLGYVGIVFYGELAMKTSAEPQQIDVTGNIANLFYSELVSNVELTPWNYYISDDKNEKVNSANKSVFSTDSPYLQEEVFYKLISEVTEVPQERIAEKYARKEMNILEKIVQGKKNGEPIELYFYKGRIRAKKQKYRVKISCDKKSIISFSCLPVIEGGMTSVAGWKEKKEAFLERLKENPQAILEEFANTYNTFYSEARGKKKLNIQKLQKKEDVIQVIELKNSILLVIEADITVGLYYDVLRDRVAGFHFFYEEE